MPPGRAVGADVNRGLALRRQVNRWMRHDDLQHRLAERSEQPMDLGHLLLVDAATLEGQRARRVDADNGDLVIDERGREVAPEVALELAERAQEALPDAVERHVVVAGHDDHRRVDAGEEFARQAELGGARALPGGGRW